MGSKSIELILLANSVRPGGKCIAGINRRDGQWVRPIPLCANKAIPSSKVSGFDILDILSIPILDQRPNPPDKYQIENEFVSSYLWKKIGRARKSDVLKYCDSSCPILHSCDDYVEIPVLEAKKPSDWKSLQLVQTRVQFENNQFGWRAYFCDSKGHYQSLKVTDPAATYSLNRNINLDGNCVLTLSLAQAWAPEDGSIIPRCYKLVAGVIK